MTALHWAAKRGNFEICYILIENSAHIDAIDIVSNNLRDWPICFVYGCLK